MPSTLEILEEDNQENKSLNIVLKQGEETIAQWGSCENNKELQRIATQLKKYNIEQMVFEVRLIPLLIRLHEQAGKDSKHPLIDAKEKLLSLHTVHPLFTYLLWVKLYFRCEETSHPVKTKKDYFFMLLNSNKNLAACLFLLDTEPSWSSLFSFKFSAEEVLRICDIDKTLINDENKKAFFLSKFLLDEKDLNKLEQDLLDLKDSRSERSQSLPLPTETSPKTSSSHFFHKRKSPTTSRYSQKAINALLSSLSQIKRQREIKTEQRTNVA